MKPKVLCVDDEPNVLAAMQLTLRREFEVVTADSGEMALTILETVPDVAVLMCDMRMPRMNGAALLARVRELHPEISRVLLTGQADLESAMSAINDGRVYQFLTKPCERETLIAALRGAAEHHRLVVSERVLLRETLHGAVEALVEVLALTAPLTFGRANRVKQRAKQLAQELGLPEAWQLEMAVSLQHLGSPQVADQILSHIPRLEPIRAILAAATRQATWSGVAGEGPIELAGSILRLANDADAIEQGGVTGEPMVDLLRHRGGHSAPLLDALQILVDDASCATVLEIPLHGLRAGMVIDEDLYLNGALLVSRGYAVTQSFVERIRHFAKGAVKEQVRILTQGVNVDQPRGAISK
jgi:CheY-like chemotaxis protein